MFFVSDGCVEFYLSCSCGEHEAPMDHAVQSKLASTDDAPSRVAGDTADHVKV